MRRGTRRVILALVILLALLVLVGQKVATRIAVPMYNPSPDAIDAAPSAEVERLHAGLFVADLHGDALLWDRNLLRRSTVGHLDVPRMTEGRVALQMFTAVTKAPFGLNIEGNDDDSDQVTLVATLQAWPPRTWTSLVERALHQAHKLHATAGRSAGRLSVITSRAELEAALARRSRDDAAVAGLLGIEGAHALEGDLANLDRLYDAGFRMIGLTHFFDNEVGGSAHGLAKGGLTDFGRAVVLRMQELGVAIDLAHASPQLIDDVLELASTPLLVSHTGVKATCDNARNLDDGQLARIAATGGVLGIGLWPEAVCGQTPAAWARAVRHAADVAGVDHVGLGSDWDGAVPTIVDASGTVHLTAALVAEGFDADEIERIMSGNVVRVLRETLPIAPGAAR